MRARKSRAEWCAIVRAFDRSKESQRGFCDRRGLKVGTLRWWISTLRHSEPSVPREIRVLPVDVKASPGALQLEPRSGGEVVVVVVSGVELRVPVGTDPQYVAVLVAELRRC